MKQDNSKIGNENRIIVEILSKNTWKNHWIDDINHDNFIIIAKKNKVLSSLAHIILQQNSDSSIKSTKLYKVLKESLLMNERDIEAYKEVLNLLQTNLTTNNIESCLLKGLSLKSEIPRDMGDLDLLIHPQDLTKAIEIVEKLGFIYKGHLRNIHMKDSEIRSWSELLKWSNQYEFLHPETGVLVELHTNFFERFRIYRFNLDPLLGKIDDFWKRAVWSDRNQCKELSLEDKVLLLTIHNSIKRSAPEGVFAFRHILDIKNLIENNEIKWEKLFRVARSTNTLPFLIYSLEMTNGFFPHLELETPISDGLKHLTPREAFLKNIMMKCYINLEFSNYLYSFFYRLFLPLCQKSYFKQKLSSLLILPALYQPRWKLRIIYIMPHNSPLVYFTYLLEPIRWVRIANRRRKALKRWDYNGR